MNIKGVYLRLSPELKAKLQERANNKGLTLVAYIRMILTERAKLEKRGKL